MMLLLNIHSMRMYVYSYMLYICIVYTRMRVIPKGPLYKY